MADFDIINNGDCSNAPIGFADLSFSTGVAVTNWLWDFGDPGSGTANTSTLQNPTHAFSSGGVFSVTLTITDANGCSAQISQNVTTLDSPTAAFNSNATSGSSCQNSEVQFFDLSASPGSPINEWVWNFGDGSPDVVVVAPDSPDVVHAFSNTGTFMVTLSVTNGNSCSDVFSQNVTVSSPDFITDFTYTIDSCLTAQFTDLSTPPPGYYLVEWYWEFGDDSTSTWPNPRHSYLTGGLYNVTLTVTADSMGFLCTNSTTLPVIVPNTPTIYYTWDPEPTCFGDTTYFFGTAGTAITDWYWNFDDGTFGTGQDIAHVYTTPGSYEVALFITDTNLCENTLTHAVTINAIQK